MVLVPVVIHEEELIPGIPKKPGKMDKLVPEEIWRMYLTGGDPYSMWVRRLLKHLPTNPRCHLCYAPFAGVGRLLMNMIGRSPSKLNPRFCDLCMNGAPVGGAEVELTLLFADVRGLTTLAEQMSPGEYGGLIQRFFATATEIMVNSNALIDRLVGDQVIALYLPAYAGPNHARIAYQAAVELVQMTGHDDPTGPWIPVGAGIHTGVAFFGKVGQGGVEDVTVLGDAPNVAARLSSIAAPGEILISDVSFQEAGLQAEGISCREVTLKSRQEPLKIWSSSVA